MTFQLKRESFIRVYINSTTHLLDGNFAGNEFIVVDVDMAS